MMRACAFSRDSARPRSTMSRSSRFFTGVSRIAMNDKIRDFAQAGGTRSEGLQHLVGARAFLVRHAMRSFQSVDGREGNLLLSRVLAGRFAESFGRLFDVEDVIDNLEGKADVFSVAGERGILRGSGGREDGSHAYAGAQQGSGLGAV